MGERKPERTGPRAETYRLLAEGKRRCAGCREIKDLSAFATRKYKYKTTNRRSPKSRCRTCVSKEFAPYYKANRAVILERSKKHYKQHYMKLRARVFAAYGDHCACCGEDEPQFLTVDHVNNDGYKLTNRYRALKDASRAEKWPVSRSIGGWTFWHQMQREGFPQDRYQILCFNCNCGRHRSPDKVCPHKKNEPRLMTAC